VHRCSGFTFALDIASAKANNANTYLETNVFEFSLKLPVS